MSKGDKRRKSQVSKDVFNDNWDRIFKVRKSTPEHASTKVHVDKKKSKRAKEVYNEELSRTDEGQLASLE